MASYAYWLGSHSQPARMMLCFRCSLGDCVGWRQSAAGPETAPARGGSATGGRCWCWCCSSRGKLPVIPFPWGVGLLLAVLQAVNTGIAKFWCCTNNDKTRRRCECWGSFVKITAVHCIWIWSVNSNATCFWLVKIQLFWSLFEKNFSLAASQNKRSFWTRHRSSVSVCTWPLFLLSSSGFLLVHVAVFLSLAGFFWTVDKSKRVLMPRKPSSRKRNLSWIQEAPGSGATSWGGSTCRASSPDPLPRPQTRLANGGLAPCHGRLRKALRALLLWTKAALRNVGIAPRSHRQKKPSPDRILLSHDGAFLHGKSVRLSGFKGWLAE